MALYLPRHFEQQDPAALQALMHEHPLGHVTPNWYPTKREGGKVVPSWNYAVVHAHGLPRFIHVPVDQRGVLQGAAQGA